MTLEEDIKRLAELRRKKAEIDEELLGGWAEVFRKDRDHPVRAEVALKDYDSGKDGPWRTHKATMIRKVPLVQAMREAFPSDLSGCYDSSEFRGAVDVESELVEG